MKPSVVKLLLIIPSVLFLDWVLMIVFGGVSKIFGASDQYFCTTYCFCGITLSVLTFLFIVYVTYRAMHSPSHKSII